MTPHDVLLRIKEDTVQFIMLQFGDIHGLPKGFIIPVSKVEDALHDGVWFDGSSIEGFTRIAESDMFLKPDPETYGVLNWISNEEGKTARLICDVHMADGNPFVGDPRYALKRALEAAAELGYEYKTGVELEFFLFNKNEDGSIDRTSRGNGYYFNADTPEDVRIKEDIFSAMKELGIDLEMSHMEVAEHQHEIDFKYAGALQTADNALTFKYVVKSIAEKHNKHATFMPKPIQGVNGSGMHTHQSLFSLEEGTNAFYDEHDPYNLSDIAKHFIAGLLHHSKEFAAIIAPTVNSYKRLTPGFEAPVYISWARQNRSALVRVPRFFKGKSAAARAELRCPDPVANCYLAFSVMLRAGLAGIKEKMELAPPHEEDMFEFDDAALDEKNIGKLPATLMDALGQYYKSTLVKQALGEHLYREFYNAKRAEWDEFRTAVTDWEIEKYLSIL